MLLSPPYALGSAGQVLSGRLLRLSQSAAFRSGASGVLTMSGCLAGAPNTMGELVLNSNTSLTVQPFRAVIQNTQDTTQGAYIATNDAAANFTTVTAPVAMPAQDASQFRRAYVAVYVADAQVAGVASTATTDRAVLDILAGPLAASAAAAAYPAVPANALLLGEMLFPPTGQAVTLTPYNPRTTTRGGILPIIVDGATTPGHDGALPSHDGATRWHPTYGLQAGRGGAWVTVGGAVQPLIPIQINAGWTNVNLGGFVDGSGMRHLSGWFTNVNSFTPGGGEVPFTLPQALWPTAARLLTVPMSIGHNILQFNLSTAGVFSIARPWGSLLGAGAVWDVSNCHYL